MKWKKAAAAALAAGMLTTCFLTGCQKGDEKKQVWKLDFDTALPTLLEEDGWYPVLYDDFTATSEFPEGDTQLNPAYWSTSPHGLRRDEYWCDQMVEVKEGTAIIHSARKTDHACSVCVDESGNPVKEGIFTGGIETRKQVLGDDGKKTDEQLFSQAFGYFEVRVKIPRAPGMWSAFWLQASGMGKIGNKGRDGSEIDVFESAFHNNPTRTGSAIHYDGYADYHQSIGQVSDTGKNLYDGEFHLYGLKWTPWEYVFYIDGEPVWATDFGGISTVPEYLRLTVEIREKSLGGPYGQRIGKFKNQTDGSTDFVIDNVKVYQNKQYEPYIRSDSAYQTKV